MKQSTEGAVWGKRALWWILGTLVLLGLAECILAAYLDFQLDGWNRLMMFMPVVIGLPICDVVGLGLSLAGLNLDADRRFAWAGLVVWGVLGLALLVFFA